MSQRLATERIADLVLDAARACVLAVGVRRTTFSDVARRAGVSRMTLYRRYPDLEALLSALMTYEFGAVVAAARSRAAAPTAPNS
jgi:AcrR family transcriptional regulator